MDRAQIQALAGLIMQVAPSEGSPDPGFLGVVAHAISSQGYEASVLTCSLCAQGSAFRVASAADLLEVEGCPIHFPAPGAKLPPAMGWDEIAQRLAPPGSSLVQWDEPCVAMPLTPSVLRLLPPGLLDRVNAVVDQWVIQMQTPVSNHSRPQRRI